jgi:uncharacterized protein YjaZ
LITVAVLSTDEYLFDDAFGSLVSGIADRTEQEVRRLLPDLPARLNVSIYPSRYVIPEIGATGVAWRKDWIGWFVNPCDERGVTDIAEVSFRHALFHELHHCARRTLDRRGTTLADAAVFEGLATVFARDAGGDLAAWAQYDHSMVPAWTTELLSTSEADHGQWFFQHPDGRRWIGYLVGTYLIDQAVAASGETAASLVGVPTEEVLSMAGYPPG